MPDRDILIVSKMPNSKEWQAELDADLKECGVPLNRVRHMSVLPERTFEDVSARQIKEYIPRVNRIIAKVNPRYILLLGNEALSTVLSHSGITKYRGRVFDQAGISAQVIPTISPSAAKRNPSNRPGYLADLRLFANLIRGITDISSDPDYAVIDTIEKLKALKKILAVTEELNFDVETHSEYWKADGRIVSLSGVCDLKTTEGKDEVFTFAIPLYHPESVWQKRHRRVLLALKEELESIPKIVAHNSTYDCKWLIAYGANVKPTFDTMMAQHVLDENRLKGLKPMAQAELGVAPWGIDTRDLLSTPLADVLHYNVLDAHYMRLLKKKVLVPKLKESPHSARLLMKLIIPGMREIIDSEMRGIWIDVKRLNERLPIALQTLADIERRIGEAAELPPLPGSPESIALGGVSDWPLDAKGKPRAINYNASLFARWMLFDWCRLPILERGKNKDDGSPGEPSMAEGVLMALRERHPVIPIMLERVKWQKYISSFLTPYSELYDSDHRIHTNFKFGGTVTGRLSSGKTDDDKITGVRGKIRGVNLQQVPRDTFIRGLFGAPPGWIFVQADYSQVELRIAAFLADEKMMKKAYQLGWDLHTITAARVTGLPEKGLPKEIRKKVGKPVNFGFLYGMGATKFISTALENYGSRFELEEAIQARDAYFELYPGLRPWHARQRALVNKYGRVQSPLGRTRNLPDIYSPEQGVRAEAERQAINSPVQGFASDLAVLSMIETNKGIRRDGINAHCLGLVHDAINYEVHTDDLPLLLPLLKETMEDMSIVERKFGVHVDVPIVADLSIGQHWGDLIELTAEEVYNVTEELIERAKAA